MRHITLAAALAAAGFVIVSAAYADNYYGPRQKGNQCFVRNNGDNGYWAPCKTNENAQAARTNANGTTAAKKK